MSRIADVDVWKMHTYSMCIAFTVITSLALGLLCRIVLEMGERMVLFTELCKVLQYLSSELLCMYV